MAKYYLPSVWEDYGIGHLECRIRRIGLHSLEFQDLYFWDKSGQEGSINRGTIEYRLNPWGLSPFLEIKGITVYGFHGTGSYYFGKFQLLGLNLANLKKLSQHFHIRNCRPEMRMQHLKIKNSHVDLLFSEHRMHLPFTMESTYIPQKQGYHIFGYLAPRGEYSIVRGFYHPDCDHLLLTLKNEKINLGCFNDFLPRSFHHNNVVGRLIASCTLRPSEGFIKKIEGEFMTGKASADSPNCIAYVHYQGKNADSGLMKYQGKLKTDSGTCTLASSDTAISIKYPFFNYKGTVYSEFFPGKQSGILILSPRIAARNNISGSISLANHKWSVKHSGEIEEGLTALLQDIGRVNCSALRFETEMSGRHMQLPQFTGSVQIPLLSLQDNRRNFSMDHITAALTGIPGSGKIRLSLHGDGFRGKFSGFTLRGRSCQGSGMLSSGKFPCSFQGEIIHLHQQYRDHEIITPSFHFSVNAPSGGKNIHINVNTQNSILQSKLHQYFTDCLQLNWNWIFNPDYGFYSSPHKNYLRCRNFRLGNGQNAEFAMQFQQQRTTACWTGKISLPQTAPGQPINLLANIHWPEWRQMPFLTMYANVPKSVLKQSPFLQDLLANALYPAQDPENNFISIWLDSNWFNGKMRIRTGYAGKIQRPTAISSQIYK